MGERLYVRRGDAFAGTLTVYVDGTADSTTNAGSDFVAELRSQRGQLLRTLDATAGAGAGEIDFLDANGTGAWPIGVVALCVSWVDSTGAERALFPPIEVECTAPSETAVVELSTTAFLQRGADSSGQIGHFFGALGVESGGGGGGSTPIFELDTTDTTDIETTTEVQGKTGPGGSAFAGTVTPSGNISSGWDSATKVLRLTTSGSMVGLGLRRVLAGTLPTAGYIVDLGIANLGALSTTRLVLACYEQRSGVNGRGVGLSFLHGDATLYATGFGDDGGDSPAVNTSPVAFDAVVGGWANALSDFTKGPARVIVEFRKVDSSSPEVWTMRVRLEGHAGAVQSHCYSGVSAPSSGWSTALDVAGASMTRLALGAWCTSAEGGVVDISHLRVYSLGSSVPA